MLYKIIIKFKLKYFRFITVIELVSAVTRSADEIFMLIRTFQTQFEIINICTLFLEFFRYSQQRVNSIIIIMINCNKLNVLLPVNLCLNCCTKTNLSVVYMRGDCPSYLPSYMERVAASWTYSMKMSLFELIRYALSFENLNFTIFSSHMCNHVSLGHRNCSKNVDIMKPERCVCFNLFSGRKPYLEEHSSIKPIKYTWTYFTAVCPRSCDPFFVDDCHVGLVTASWTYYMLLHVQYIMTILVLPILHACFYSALYNYYHILGLVLSEAMIKYTCMHVLFHLEYGPRRNVHSSTEADAWMHAALFSDYLLNENTCVLRLTSVPLKVNHRLENRESVVTRDYIYSYLTYEYTMYLENLFHNYVCTRIYFIPFSEYNTGLEICNYSRTNNIFKCFLIMFVLSNYKYPRLLYVKDLNTKPTLETRSDPHFKPRTRMKKDIRGWLRGVYYILHILTDSLPRTPPPLRISYFLPWYVWAGLAFSLFYFCEPLPLLLHLILSSSNKSEFSFFPQKVICITIMVSCIIYTPDITSTIYSTYFVGSELVIKKNISGLYPNSMFSGVLRLMVILRSEFTSYCTYDNTIQVNHLHPIKQLYVNFIKFNLKKNTYNRCIFSGMASQRLYVDETTGAFKVVTVQPNDGNLFNQQDAVNQTSSSAMSAPGENANEENAQPLFCFTEPAIRAEILRQKNHSVALLMNEPANYTAFRRDYDLYIGNILEEHLMHRSKVSLPQFEGEPASRNLTPGTKNGGWFCEEAVIGSGINGMNVQMTLPPNRPMCIIVGASHCSRMANLDINAAPTSNFGKSQIWAQRLWSTVGFARIKGSARTVLPILEEILANIALEMVSCYGSFEGTGTHWVFIPNSWDAVDDDITLDQYTIALLKTSQVIFTFMANLRFQQRWNLSFSFSELPILHHKETHIYRINHIVREINEMITPNHSPIRSWWVCTKPNEKNIDHQKQLRIGKLSDRHCGFEHHDQRHLSAKGYLQWLTEILNSGMMSIKNNLSVEDFVPAQVVSVPDGDRSSYFARTASIKLQIEFNVLDTEKHAALRRLESPHLDCNKLLEVYKDYSIISVINEPKRRTPYDVNRRLDDFGHPLLGWIDGPVRSQFLEQYPAHRGGGRFRGRGRGRARN